MQVNFKSMKGETFQLNVEGTETIASLKERILAEKDKDVDKLIHQGKLLDNEKTVESYNVKAGDQVIMMVKKVKAPAPAPAVAAPAPTPTPATPATPAPAAATTPATPTPSTPTQATPAATAESPGIVLGAQLQETVNQMVAMGFPEDQVLVAMRAAFNNPDRAMQYLLDGIPPELAASAAAPPAQAAAPAATPAAAPAASPAATPAAAPAASPAAAPWAPAAGGEDANITPEALQQALGQANQPDQIEQLRQAIPGLDQLLQVVRQNPAALQPLLQQLGQTRPDLLQLITENQGAFLQMLQGEGGAGGGAPPGMVQIQVTPEEREAIDRLMALGFSEHAALEAFMTCDKDENLAANFLFENGGFGDD